MRLTGAVAAGLCAAAGFAIGWPWGVPVVAGCVALSLAGVWLLARAAGLCWRSAPPSREPLTVRAMVLNPAEPVSPARAELTAETGREGGRP